MQQNTAEDLSAGEEQPAKPADKRVAKRPLPTAVWFQRIQQRGGKILVKPHKGVIHSYNAIYHRMVMEIDGSPAMVPWDECMVSRPMKFKIYEYGGTY